MADLVGKIGLGIVDLTPYGVCHLAGPFRVYVAWIADELLATSHDLRLIESLERMVSIMMIPSNIPSIDSSNSNHAATIFCRLLPMRVDNALPFLDLLPNAPEGISE